MLLCGQAYADRVAAIENPMAVPSDKQLPLWHLAQDLLDWLIDERAELAAQVEDLSETNRRTWLKSSGNDVSLCAD